LTIPVNITIIFKVSKELILCVFGERIPGFGERYLS